MRGLAQALCVVVRFFERENFEVHEMIADLTLHADGCIDQDNLGTFIRELDIKCRILYTGVDCCSTNLAAIREHMEGLYKGLVKGGCLSHMADRCGGKAEFSELTSFWEA